MSLSSRAVAAAAGTGCPRLAGAARKGWSDTSLAKAKGVVAIAPRLAFLEGVDFERRALGKDASEDDRLLERLEAQGKVVRLPETLADSEMYDQFTAALADPEVTVILQGVLPGLYGGYHRPDVLVRRGEVWQVGEVKVYLDRSGETPERLVQSTALQAAVSIVAARRIGMQVTDEAQIILAHQFKPVSVRPLDVGGEVELIEHFTSQAPPPKAASTSMPDLDEHRYDPSVCEGTCALAEVCRKEQAEAPGVIWPTDTVAPTYGWAHTDLLALCEQGLAPSAVQAGWDAAGC